MGNKVSMTELAKKIYSITNTDRGVVAGVGGFTGEGKSCFATQLQEEYGKVSGTGWDFNRMTWSRKELLTWIDGKPKSAIKDGLKEGQLPKHSAILAEELFHMFYRRTWYDVDQIGAIATFNMCRDRNLFVAGNVPSFWDLDAAFLKQVMFYIYIYERGTAYVFQQENNPFSKDTWNVNENKKVFRKHHNPFSISNFVCEIKFNDWNKEAKKEYYKIRNIKRLKAIHEYKEQRERYKDIKDQRDFFINGWKNERKQISKRYRLLCTNCKKVFKPYSKEISNKTMADISGLSDEAIRQITQKGDFKTQKNNIPIG